MTDLDLVRVLEAVPLMAAEYGLALMHRKPNQPVRVRIERGIYRRTNADGSTRYEVSYKDEGRRQRWRTCTRLQEARDLRADLVSKVARGEVVAPAKVTFGELAESWYESKAPRVRRGTARYYRDSLDLVLLPRFGKVRVSAIDPDEIAKLTRDLERKGLAALDPSRKPRPLGSSSVSNYLKPLQAVLALAVRRRLIQSNPFDVLLPDDRPARRTRSTPHEWTPEQVDALIAAAKTLADRKISKYDYAPLLRLVATLGLRKGEALGLKWRDFDREGGYLTVERQWTQYGEYTVPKTKAGVRRIALPQSVRDELIALKLRSRFSDNEHPIYASVVGSPLDHGNVSTRGFEPARDLAGLPSTLTFHSLRHAAASRLIRAGLDPVTVASVLGHEDATTTLSVYAHLFDRERTDEAVRAALADVR
jgi:integrase